MFASSAAATARRAFIREGIPNVPAFVAPQPQGLEICQRLRCFEHLWEKPT